MWICNNGQKVIAKDWLSFEKYLAEDYLKSNNCQYSYNQLFKDTISDIDKKFNQVKVITLL